VKFHGTRSVEHYSVVKFTRTIMTYPCKLYDKNCAFIEVYAGYPTLQQNIHKLYCSVSLKDPLSFIDLLCLCLFMCSLFKVHRLNA